MIYDKLMRLYTKLFNEDGTRWVKWFNGSENSKMFQGKNKESYIKLFQTLLIKANWQDSKHYNQNGRTFHVRKGEVITKRENLADASNLTKRKVGIALKRFEEEGAIINPNGLSGIGKTIFIVNYTAYQEKHKEHPKKHYYCPEQNISDIKQEKPKCKKTQKVSEVSNPSNNLEVLINKLSNNPSLADKLLTLLDSLDDENVRTTSEVGKNSVRSTSEVSSKARINKGLNRSLEYKEIKIIKKKESKKKDKTDLLFSETKGVRQDVPTLETTQRDKTTQLVSKPQEANNKTDEIPQALIKAYLLATEKITPDATGPFKTHATEKHKKRVWDFLKVNPNLTDEEFEYLFKSAAYDIKLHANPENRDNHRCLDYIFQRVSDPKFFLKTMQNYQKHKQAIIDSMPKEHLTYKLHITEECLELNNKFHQKLQQELSHNGRFFYDKHFKDKVFIGGYDRHTRVLRLHFESLTVYQFFQVNVDYQLFLLKVLGLAGYNMCLNETKNMIMLPVYSPDKIIHWKYIVQGELFDINKSKETLEREKQEREEKERQNFIALGLLLQLENYRRFGFVNVNKGGRVYESYSQRM